MDASKKYMAENAKEYGDRISFKDDGPIHTVKILKDKEDTIPDGQGGKVKGMKYLVEEDGVQKTIFTGSIGLVSKLAKCNAGDVVTIKLGTANNKSFYTVTKEGEEIKEEGEVTPTGDGEEPSAEAEW